jgi:hypothetical protein
MAEAAPWRARRKTALAGRAVIGEAVIALILEIGQQ